MLTIAPLDDAALDEAAHLLAREHVRLRSRRPQAPIDYNEPRRCHQGLSRLLANGFSGFTAHEEGVCVGVMCGRTIDGVGFIPAHGLTVDPDLADATAVMVALFAEVAPILRTDGASRFTIDHVDIPEVAVALNDVGFARGCVFASQPARARQTPPEVEIRLGSTSDLDAIAALSHLEFAYRSTPPIYADQPARTLAETRAHHDELLAEGARHFLASFHGNDVGLLTVELTSPAPRLLPNDQPYIGPTATHASARGRGVGHALVQYTLHWAHTNGYETVSVDFDSANPLSRPFWLGLDFEPVGYRVRRSINAPASPSGPQHEP